MPIKFANDKPIFIQLADHIKSDIVSGKFKTNDKLPSVREFALEFQVNPNTIQKALQILEEEGLIVTDRTNGKFISGNTNQLEIQKNKIIKQEVDLFFKRMKTYGLNAAEIKEIINKLGE